MYLTDLPLYSKFARKTYHFFIGGKIFTKHNIKADTFLHYNQYFLQTNGIKVGMQLRKH